MNARMQSFSFLNNTRAKMRPSSKRGLSYESCDVFIVGLDRKRSTIIKGMPL